MCVACVQKACEVPGFFSCDPIDQRRADDAISSKIRFVLDLHVVHVHVFDSFDCFNDKSNAMRWLYIVAKSERSLLLAPIACHATIDLVVLV